MQVHGRAAMHSSVVHERPLDQTIEPDNGATTAQCNYTSQPLPPCMNGEGAVRTCKGLPEGTAPVPVPVPDQCHCTPQPHVPCMNGVGTGRVCKGLPVPGPVHDGGGEGDVERCQSGESVLCANHVCAHADVHKLRCVACLQSAPPDQCRESVRCQSGPACSRVRAAFRQWRTWAQCCVARI